MPASSNYSSDAPDNVLGPLGLARGANEGVVTNKTVKLSSRGQTITSYCPSTGKVLGKVDTAHEDDVPALVDTAQEAFQVWRQVPAPQRGQILLEIRDALKEHKQDLGALVSLEMGKIHKEGMGEVQESIDICDYAIGLSRMIAGKVVPSERSDHFLMEVPAPLGVTLVITAFNFPNAVFFWNFALNFVCGNATIWKPSPSASLIAIATMRIVTQVLEKNKLPVALATLCCGDTSVSKALTEHPGIPLVSFTGSEKTGRIVGGVVQGRLGKLILELGGNNAVIVMPDADLELALRTVVFGAVGTAGQRCTTTRRLFLHESLADDFVERLKKAYGQVRIGDPLAEGTLMGPGKFMRHSLEGYERQLTGQQTVHTQTAIDMYQKCLDESKQQGGKLICGDQPVQHSDDALKGGYWLSPAIVFHGDKHPKVMEEETFAPILHVSTFKTLKEAIELNNSVRQGLSSSLFTNDMQSVFQWCSASGSDCGIVNVNQSTSGAEIGCGFGGNKATGSGRESGGDAWKQYCSWKSCTINYGSELGLAQGIKFE